MAHQQLTLKDIALLIIPVLLGGCCLLLWWYELHQVVGWQGLNWIKQPLVVIYIITGLVVAAFLLPIIVELKVPVVWIVIYALLLYAISLGTYFTAKGIFYTLYTKGLMMGNQNVIAGSIWKLMGVVILWAMVYFIPIRHFHNSTDGMHIITIMVAIISVVPASLICIECLPLWSTQMAFIDAVKVGYPVFWAPIFLGLLSTAAVKEWI
ncbi:hypothetical protein [Aureispira anguillae]|uniref:Uncharacterized protein n=1 Tax=Aureispira anguillae TaxID=2864201 RepID=A0A916DTM1_9BACT|nr:hypothetical protein [Aureispira anguillae]BDS13359.1 hypothetical protein AsAng_0040960 [Aureispira anguillae]